MIVGAGMKVSGSIEGDEDLVVRGRIEGGVRISGALTVEPGGFVGADVHARAATVFGTVLGNVTATESIEVARTGQMVGDATAPRVSIVPGAAFRGRLEMGDVKLPALDPSAAIPPATVAALPAAAAPMRALPAKDGPGSTPRPPGERRGYPRGGTSGREVPRLATPSRGPMRRRPER